MKWIIFYQGFRDNIYYITNLSSEKDYLKYYVFLKFLNTEFTIIKDFLKLKDALDKFKTVLLYEDGSWELIKDEKKDVSFSELYEINVTQKENEDKSIIDYTIEKSKKFIDGIAVFNKNKFKKGFKK